MRIVVCDDSANDRTNYSTLIAKLAEKHNMFIDLKLYESGNSLLYSFENPDFFADIIFISVEMETVSGIETAKKLREMNYKNEIVFLANNKDCLGDGYDVSAFNYIIKSEVTDEKFENIFLGAVDSIKENTQRICLFNGGGLHKNIALSDIKYFSIKLKIATVHFNSETFDFPCTIEKLEREFEIYGFIRIKRSHLVSVKYIESINSDKVSLQDGTKISINKKAYKKLKKLLKYFSGSMAIE